MKESESCVCGAEPLGIKTIIFVIALIVFIVVVGIIMSSPRPATTPVPSGSISGVIEEVLYLPDDFVSIRYKNGWVVKLKLKEAYGEESGTKLRPCIFQIGEKSIINYEILHPYYITGYRLDEEKSPSPPVASPPNGIQQKPASDRLAAPPAKLESKSQPILPTTSLPAESIPESKPCKLRDPPARIVPPKPLEKPDPPSPPKPPDQTMQSRHPKENHTAIQQKLKRVNNKSSVIAPRRTITMAKVYPCRVITKRHLCRRKVIWLFP